MKPAYRSTIETLDRISANLPWFTRCAFHLLPPRCHFCAGEGDLRNVDLCTACLERMPWSAALEQRRLLASGVAACSALDYRPPVAESLKRLKFAGDRTAARVLGALLAATVSAVAAEDSITAEDSIAAVQDEARLRMLLPDVLLPIPLHHARQIERGFNQSFLLAREAGRWLRLPVCRGGLLRVRETRPQTQLHATERRQNVAGAFVVLPGLRAELERRGAIRIALIDDVLTTGATLDAAVEALRAAGFHQVQCWSVARATPTKTTRLT